MRRVLGAKSSRHLPLFRVRVRHRQAIQGAVRGGDVDHAPVRESGHHQVGQVLQGALVAQRGVEKIPRFHQEFQSAKGCFRVIVGGLGTAASQRGKGILGFRCSLGFAADSGRAGFLENMAFGVCAAVAGG